MFTGEHLHSLDDKKRVSVPQRLRESMTPEDISAGFYLTLGFEGSLLLYPRQEWDRMAAKVEELPSTHREARKFQRLFLANAQFVTLDRQKRILLSESHCRLVGIAKDIVFLGVGRHIEIWPRQSYKKYMESVKDDYEALAEAVLPGTGRGGSDSAGGAENGNEAKEGVT